jgi:signal-transduction protein with cAMP-binding, CBS, and nucleotidyltransferase domain
VVELLERLKSYPPFSYLEDSVFKKIEMSAQVAYYPDGTTLIDISQKPEQLYFIIKGIVEASS